MPEKQPSFIAITITLVCSVIVMGLVGTFIYLLIDGRASVPDAITQALTGAVIALITGGVVYLNSVVTRRQIEQAVQLQVQRSDANAMATQAAIVQSATATQAHVEKVNVVLHNGIKEDFARAAAELVRIDAAEVAKTLPDTAGLAQALREQTLVMALAANTAPPAPPAPPEQAPSATELHENTAAVESNTSATLDDTHVRLTALEGKADQPPKGGTS